jgi:hypothetical protein
MSALAPLGALSQAWVSAEMSAAARLGDQPPGALRQRGIALSEGPSRDDHIEANGAFVVQALQRLADRLRERRGSATG